MTRYQVQRLDGNGWIPVRTNDESADGNHSTMSEAHIALNDIRRMCLNCEISPPRMRVEVVEEK